MEEISFGLDWEMTRKLEIRFKIISMLLSVCDYLSSELFANSQDFKHHKKCYHSSSILSVADVCEFLV